MEKKFFKGLFFLLIGLFTIALLIYTINGNPSSMQNENSMKDYQTIKDLLISGSVKDDTWYWVDDRPGSIQIDVASPSIPLLEGKKAYVVTPEYYPQGDYGEDSAWQALCSKKYRALKGKNTF